MILIDDALRRLGGLLGWWPAKSPLPSDVDALRERLLARAEQRSLAFPDHHAVFDAFPPLPFEVRKGWSFNYNGCIWPAKFGFWAVPEDTVLTPPPPPIDEEYFEFVDIFESVLDAGDTYTMMEWGAGFGRWAGAAARVARRRGGIRSIRLALCEAEPVHREWIVENMALQDVPTSDYRIYPVAVSNEAGEMLFVIGMPPGRGADDPTSWYGQALSGQPAEAFIPTGASYHGLSELVDTDGWRAIAVKVVPASKIIADYDFIDLLDMDIQGAEADAVEESIGLINQRVRRLHIGTHSAEIETRLRACLSAHDWINTRDLPCLQTVHTEFGAFYCNDGVQSWYNPRLAAQR